MSPKAGAFKKVLILEAHALVGWMGCALVMGLGLAWLPEETALVVHAALAPVIFLALSWFYHRRFAYTPPLVTALVFTLTIMVVDLVLVALVVLGSLEMFESFVGSWLPFLLIFLASLGGGAAWGLAGRRTA